MVKPTETLLDSTKVLQADIQELICLHRTDTATDYLTCVHQARNCPIDQSWRSSAIRTSHLTSSGNHFAHLGDF